MAGNRMGEWKYGILGDITNLEDGEWKTTILKKYF